MVEGLILLSKQEVEKVEAAGYSFLGKSGDGSDDSSSGSGEEESKKKRKKDKKHKKRRKD